MELVTDKPVINLPGCPPIPEVMTGTVAYLLSFAGIPELDHLGRPKAFFGEAIHDRCYRRPFYEQGKFAETFDDEGAKAGWCLYKLGCKGPTTYNACATIKWDAGLSFPIQSGHPCIGCSQPNFWDGGGFYKAISIPTEDITRTALYSAAVGIAAGVFITAVHHMGLATLTHTPSPMGFMTTILERPHSERPFVLFPVGYPADDATVPDLVRKPLDQIAVFDPPLADPEEDE